MKSLVLHNNNHLVNDFDRLFDSVFGLPAVTRSRSVAVDVRETKDQYILEAELPGYSEKDVEIRVEDNLLVIESHKEKEQEEKHEGWLIRERQSTGFRRTFVLPKEVDQERIDASYRDGLLTLTIPKTEKAKPRTITINRAA